MTTTEPVINIVRPSNHRHNLKRPQQRPNRDRLIAPSAIAIPTSAETTDHLHPLRQTPVKATIILNNLPKGILKKRNLETTEETSSKSTHAQHSSEIKSKPDSKPHINIADSKEKGASNSHTEKPENVVEQPMKPKKIKPKVKIPEKPEEISSNWESLKKKLDAEAGPKKPRRTIRRPPSKPVPQSEAATANETEKEPQTLSLDDLPEATENTFVKTQSFAGLTKAVAMDCEFVGIGPGGQDNMLARVSIVNLFGHCVYDTFVKPTELVKDYRTHVSGVRPQDLKSSKAKEFKVVQKEVADILEGRILVGHAVYNDLAVLLLGHPRSNIRDTSKFKMFRKLCGGGIPSLKKLTAKALGFKVQTGEHNSVQDAQATMRLYTKYKKEWESTLKLERKSKKTKQTPSA